MTDRPEHQPPVPPGPGTTPEREVGIDVAAFLPEGAELAAAEPTSDLPAEPDPWGADAPEPEVPAWARDDAEPQPWSPPADAAAGAPAAVERPRPSADDQIIDLDALSALEADLAAVDGALAALDAGDPSRSPLLVDLLDL